MTASRFPHPLTLLVACILLAAALSWVLPAGEYQRQPLTPTNGALMAMLAACGVPYDQWVRFAVPVLGVLVTLAAAAIGVAVVVGV